VFVDPVVTTSNAESSGLFFFTPSLVYVDPCKQERLLQQMRNRILLY